MTKQGEIPLFPILKWYCLFLKTHILNCGLTTLHIHISMGAEHHRNLLRFVLKLGSRYSFFHSHDTWHSFSHHVQQQLEWARQFKSIRQEQNTGAHYLPRLCTNIVINDIFYGQIIVSMVSNSILLSRDQCEKKDSVFMVADNNLTLIYFSKPLGLVVLSGHALHSQSTFASSKW